MSGLIIDAERCVGCRRCERACGSAGIEVVDRRARVTDGCILCGACVDACPVDAISIERTEVASPVDAQDVWVVAQLDAAGDPLAVTLELIGQARELADSRGCRVVALLAEPSGVPPAHGGSDGAASLLIACGADEVLRARDERFAAPDAQVTAAWVAGLARARHPEIVLFGATATGRALAPAVAIQLRTGLTADCTSLAIDPATSLLQQTRPAFGGNLMATIVCPAHRPQMATVRPGVFAAPTLRPDRTGVVTEVSLDPAVRPRVRRLAFDPVTAASIVDAEVLVVVGRGIGSKKNLPLMRRLADLLGAQLGCTRPIVEAGWLAYPHQVGQTGVSVAPRLLVSVGVSGAIQHLAGIGGAETVIAINEDPDAPIFGAAHYRVVGDCIEVVSELVARLEETQA